MRLAPAFANPLVSLCIQAGQAACSHSAGAFDILAHFLVGSWVQLLQNPLLCLPWTLLPPQQPRPCLLPQTGCSIIAGPVLRWYLLGHGSSCDLLTLLLQPPAWTCISGPVRMQPIITRRSPHPWSTGRGRQWSPALSTCCWVCCTFSWRVSATLTYGC